MVKATTAAATATATATAKKVTKKTAEKAAPKKAAPKKAAPKKAAPKKTSDSPKEVGDLTPTQVKILKVLVKKPLTGKEIAESAGVDPTVIGNAAGYRKDEINERPCHAGNLLNRGLVKLLVPEEGSRGYRFEITAKGKTAAK